MSVGLGEETGMVAEEMGKNRTSHTPKTDSGADRGRSVLRMIVG